MSSMNRPENPTHFRVYADGHRPVEVDAENWITALGKSVEMLKDSAAGGRVGQLACEVLANGTVIVRDARTGRHFVIHDLDGQPDVLQGETPLVDDAGHLALPEEPAFALPGDEEGSVESVLPAAQALLAEGASNGTIRLLAAMAFAVVAVVGAALGSFAAIAGP